MRALSMMIVLALLGGACRTTGNTKIQKMGRAHDVEGLLGSWDDATSDQERGWVIDALVQSPDEPTALELVERESKANESPEVRLAAVRALASFRGPKAIAALIAALGDPWPAVRTTARQGLGSKGAEAHAPLLEAGTKSPHHVVRATALQILSLDALTIAEVRPWVVRLLEDKARQDDAPSVRLAAVEGLGDLGAQSARGLLIDLARTDADTGVRLGAERSIKKLGERPADQIAVVAVLPLRDASEGKDPELVRIGKEISEYVAARLSGARVCDVVDREKLETALAELKKVGHAVYEGESPNVPEIGRFKIANQLVYGSVSKQGPVYTLIVNRMDVATLQLVPGASATVTGYKADLEQLKVELAERFLASFR